MEDNFNIEFERVPDNFLWSKNNPVTWINFFLSFLFASIFTFKKVK